jgi:hypothetical protein
MALPVKQTIKNSLTIRFKKLTLIGRNFTIVKVFNR